MTRENRPLGPGPVSSRNEEPTMFSSFARYSALMTGHRVVVPANSIVTNRSFSQRSERRDRNLMEFLRPPQLLS
jgi:hypothetical protein